MLQPIAAGSLCVPTVPRYLYNGILFAPLAAQVRLAPFLPRLNEPGAVLTYPSLEAAKDMETRNVREPLRILTAICSFSKQP